MGSKDLMRRRPGQNGCCGCSLGAMLGATLLATLGLWRLIGRGRNRAAR